MRPTAKDLIIDVLRCLLVSVVLLSMIVLLMLAMADFQFARRDYGSLRVFNGPAPAQSDVVEPTTF